MKEQDVINFNRIAEAIDFIQSNYKDQPRLEEVAEKLNLSPFHFQRLFTEWAGISPKKFLQYISIAHAKKLLLENKASLLETAHEVGFSGPSRLHDLFMKIEGMTPGEYKNGGESLKINYCYAETPFGPIILASTKIGICHIAFADVETSAFETLQKKFPNASFNFFRDSVQEDILAVFDPGKTERNLVKLHLKGTDFQLKVWEALLRIPMGKLTSYDCIAKLIQHPKASRAVGSAVGQNPVAFFIPCHRVIQSTGVFGQYHWGSTRKMAMIGWESAKVETTLNQKG